MTKFKQISKRIALVLLIVIPISALAHFIIFPQQTRSILISYSGFNKDGRLYFNNNTPQNKVDTVKQLIELAANRVAGFWGQKPAIRNTFIAKAKKILKSMAVPIQFRLLHTSNWALIL